MNTTALQYSVKLLSRKDYSEYKLRQKLEKKEFTILEIDDAILILKEKRYLNEERYTEDRVTSLILRDYGNLYIKNKLTDENLIADEDIINSIRSERKLQEESVIAKLVLKKNQSLGTKPLIEKKSKISNYLLNKGFDYYYVEKALEDLD